MDFNLVREKMNSAEGKEFLSRLNDMNVTVQQLEYTLNLRKMAYAFQSLKYKEFLGYDLTEDEKQEIKNLKENLSKLKGVLDNETIQFKELV